MRNKTLLAAGYIRDIEFRNKVVYDLYICDLDHRKVAYVILDTFNRADGSFIVRILQQYNNVDLIQL